MTMLSIWKKCPKCHRKYVWNPDVGNFNCPYCHGLGTQLGELVGSIFGKKKDTLKNRENRENKKKN